MKKDINLNAFGTFLEQIQKHVKDLDGYSLSLKEQQIKWLLNRVYELRHIVNMIHVGGCPRSKEDRQMIEGLADEAIAKLDQEV